MTAIRHRRIAGKQALEIVRYVFIDSPIFSRKGAEKTQKRKSWRSLGAGLAHQCDLPSVSTFSEDLICHHADQDHGAHHREVERTGNAEEVDEIAQDLKQRGADQYANHRTFAAAQRTSPEHRRGDSIEFVSIAVIGGRNRVGIKSEDDPGDACE